jgi:RNA polymerase sigma factor (sigma-70 family)
MRFEEDPYYISQTLAGDLQGFAMLVEKHEKSVFTLCVRMLKNREEAEEATQDSFVKVYQNLKGFASNSKFSTWLYRISFNECLARLRKKKVEISLNEEISESESAAVEWGNGLNLLVKEERETLVRKSIESLSPNEAAILTFFYLEELSIKEISSITSYSESNIKVTLHRGRKNLTQMLIKSTLYEPLGVK